MQRLIFLLLLCAACRTTPPPPDTSRIDYRGETMGTTYSVIYFDSLGRNFQPEMDSLLLAINAEVSTYEENSFISRWNRSDAGYQTKTPLAETHPHFTVNLENAFDTHARTDGQFDPTIMPLVNLWGFGYTQKRLDAVADSVNIDSLRMLVGLTERVQYHPGQFLIKTLPGVQLDFSANAKGYAVDELGRLLERALVTDYFVEIGGEVRARGQKPDGSAWTIGINVPREDAALNEVQTIVELRGRGNTNSVATSGNYRNYYDVAGERVSHIINPKTGYPERRTLLSASVFAENCMVADAYATAFMVMGTEAAFDFATQQPELEAYLIFADEANEMKFIYTEGLAEVFRE